jgi:ATP-dependent helicase/nuclease subunit A
MNVLQEIINPKKSIFVSASAGSGKTFVLVLRVLSLLLKGEDPSKILCITFTTAAANEMKERIKLELKKWHEGENIEKNQLFEGENDFLKGKARKLYTEVVLMGKFPKICTFHAFCLEVINSFSVEGDLPFKISILSTISELELKDRVLKNIILNEKTRSYIKQLSPIFSINALSSTLITKITSSIYRDNFASISDIKIAYEVLGIEFLDKTLKELMDFLEKKLLSQINQMEIPYIVDALNSAENLLISDLESLRKLEEFLHTNKLDTFISIFLTKEQTPRKNIFTKKTVKNFPELENWMEKYKNICNDYIIEKKAYFSAKTTEIITFLAKEILIGYKEEKLASELLDFDDLIISTNIALLGEWRDFILFKLNGGIRHILVDEAQDTNFKQWNILFQILEEFFSKENIEGEAKSLFIVGDEKQSIFSFQGANPSILKFVYEKYKNNLSKGSLRTSYRTSSAILKIVDKIFFEEKYGNAISKTKYEAHYSNRDGDFGKIEIIPLPEPEDKTKNIITSWVMPWEENQSSKNGIKNSQAIQITDKILEILREKRFLTKEKYSRPVQPSDFMLIIKNRDEELFTEIQNILASHKIGVSFGDKQTYEKSLPILDFIHLLKALLNPKDNHSLACVLRSPIFDLSDDQIEEIFLFKTLEIPKLFSELRDYLSHNLEEFFVEMFAKFHLKYRSCDWKEISQIFVLIEEYKQDSQLANFEGFIQFFEKNQNSSFALKTNQNPQNININTVHGSKGLEAPIVFILNATENSSAMEARENFAFNNEENYILFGNASCRTPEWEALRKEKKLKDYEEYLRLLYVAITRAEDELYIFGKKIQGGEDEESDFKSWYEIIRDSLEGERVYFTGEPVFKNEISASPSILNEIIYINQKLSPPKTNISKQEKRGATQKAEEFSKFLEHGKAIHLLLQLEKNLDKARADNFLSIKFPSLNLEERNQIIESAQLNVIKFPEIFNEGTSSEIAINQILENENVELSIRIDKLIVKEKEVWVIDFKYYAENRLNPEIMEQLSIYKNTIAEIYPNKKIRTFVLWIKTSSLEEIFY